MLDLRAFLLQAGNQMPTRDMSPYNGKPFQCSCGRTHEFDSSYLDYRNFGASGANSRMIVTCPSNPTYTTLIQTKYKFMVVFDRFISIAGCSMDHQPQSDAWKKTLIKDLLILSAIDGEIDSEEMEVLLKDALSMGIPAEEFYIILSDPSTVADIYPVDDEEKIQYLLRLIRMTFSDGEIDPKEMNFMRTIAQEMDLSPTIIDDLINHILED